MEHSDRDRIINLCNESINRLLDRNQSIRSGRDWRIFRVLPRVPPSLLNVQKNAFLPRTISIGPFHYVSPSKDAMYPLKLSLLQHLLEGKVGEINRSKTDEKIESRSHKEVRLKDLVEAMMDMEQRTREFYAETFDISSDEFVNMMVIDGCFVIELLRLHYQFSRGELSYGSSDWHPRDSPIFATRWLLPSLRRDLIKLENQLPYIVLEMLFSLTTSEDIPSLPQLSEHFFCPMLSQNGYMLDSDKSKYSDPYGHLVNLVGILLYRASPWRRYHYSKAELIYSAQQLQEAGIKFIRKQNSNLLDINFDFHNGVLQIPPLSIDENVTTVLSNMVAFEQCTSFPPIFTNYFLFLDSLINNTKDVIILSQNGIIKYPLGTEKEVVHLFNNFCKEIVHDFDQTYLLVDMDEVNDYCKAFYDSQCHFWWRNLRRERFSNPWTFLSLVAAIFLLILTLLQTIYTMVSYHHPN